LRYVQSTLTPRERIIYEAHLSMWSMAFAIVLGIATLVFYGFGLLLLLAVFVRYRSTEMAITNKRVVAKFGFIKRRTIELSLAKVESVQVEQGVFGRIFGYGTLVVSGAGVPSAPIAGISNPMVFRSMVFEAQEEAAQPADLKLAA
jgi:uncharacterized membrane protein YdbT with pleckstrin-like domain